MEMISDWFIRPAAIIMVIVAISSFLLLLYVLIFFPQCPRCESRRVKTKTFLAPPWGDENDIHAKEHEKVRTTRITCLDCGNVGLKN